MNQLPRFLIIVFVIAWSSLGAISAPANSAEVVFDNTINPDSNIVGGPGCCQVGNEITLGGTARKIIRLSWLVDSQNTDVLAEIETRIYANDSPAGAPGTLLWSSGELIGVPVSSTDRFLDIEVPEIVVPDMITITSRISYAVPVGLARIFGGSPSVGSVNASWLEDPPGVWNQWSGPWGMQVLAVPERAPVSLMIIKPHRFRTKKKVLVKVGIISTEQFDATSQIDRDSLTFGRTGDEESLLFCQRKPWDVDRDGSKDDLVCYFFVRFKCGDTEGILKGKTLGGDPVEGSTPILVKQCK